MWTCVYIRYTWYYPICTRSSRLLLQHYLIATRPTRSLFDLLSRITRLLPNCYMITHDCFRIVIRPYWTKLDCYTIYSRSLDLLLDHYTIASRHLSTRSLHVKKIRVGSPSHADQAKPPQPLPITHADRARLVPDRLIELIWLAVRSQHNISIVKSVICTCWRYIAIVLLEFIV